MVAMKKFKVVIKDVSTNQIKISKIIECKSLDQAQEIAYNLSVDIQRDNYIITSYDITQVEE